MSKIIDDKLIKEICTNHQAEEYGQEWHERRQWVTLEHREAYDKWTKENEQTHEAVKKKIGVPCVRILTDPSDIYICVDCLMKVING